MFAVTYLIYILAWESLVLGGCSYLVFWRGADPHWFWFAVFLTFCALNPKKWCSLFHPRVSLSRIGRGHMRKLTMSMCASRDYLQGYNKAVDDASKEMDALQARVAELEAAMERIIAGPYAGQFASAADVAVEALKR